MIQHISRQVIACRRCPRLVAFTDGLRHDYPDYWNKPVPSFGDRDAWLGIVGLAPGLHGANRSGRPFFMDASGKWLYGELERRKSWDGEHLDGAFILNAVKCVPPQNRPTGPEQEECRVWLDREFEALKKLRVVLALGGIAHRAVLRSWGMSPLSAYPFAHGAHYEIEGRPTLLTSYHPSRQNTNTGRLTLPMWRAIFERATRLRNRKRPR
ncbi:MAG: uracil-DNA glycosylase [bacterium]|nr:uracil-DNA glycosylase [bacterium]